MDHNEIKEMLSEFYDGGLGPEERVRIEAHLADCPDCRLALDRWNRIAGTLFVAQQPVGSDGAFVARVMERIRAEEDREDAPLGFLESLRAGLLWQVPAYGLGLAAFFLIITLTGNGEAVSTETILLADSAQSTTADCLLQTAAPEPDILLSMEEP